MEQTKKPEDHTVRLCLPQKNEPNLSSRVEADLDFNFPMVSDRQTDGGASRRKWTWFSSPLISVILHWTFSATDCRFSNRKSRFSEVSI